MSKLLQCHFSKCLMPVLRADYVDKAVSRDLCAVCEEMGNGEEYSWVFQTYCW